ncbi:pectate lyase-like adhesive domain-containing protein [Enterococcus sp. BWR-S5]|uniref:pectate lyase-like adhesive domain-containing protein n=1 Tax=Enterococcus sp. BWR-S5 TaxID=2787714 RepID=UPI0019204948|nr:pectate lyase-like adhesive domain-containing protein [Enterococcus sp. BWR-S5]MBL1227330.1 isopeptide-forming domain-containing fimbrial protein [Enterococcus sp. BWR-S5]
MKLKTKNNVLVVLFLIFGLVVSGLLQMGTPLKAESSRYMIEVSENNKATIRINPQGDEELKLKLTNLKEISEEDVTRELSEDFDGDFTVEKDGENSFLLKIKEGNNPLVFALNLSQKDAEKSGDVKLLSSTDKVLAEKSISFFEPELTEIPNMETAQMLNRNSTDYVPPTQAELDAANATANARFNFNPEANVKTVTDWATFKAAYEDNSVTKIIMAQSISKRATGNNTALYLSGRNSSIEIDGQGFELDLYNDTLALTATPAAGKGNGFVHVHDLTAVQGLTRSDADGVLGGYRTWGFIMGYVTSGTAYARNWYFRVGNIDTRNEENYKIARLIRGTRGEITTYGKMNLYTTSENYYAGSIVVEDKTEWYGNVTVRDYSLVWYELPAEAGDTGESKEFTVGKNCYLRFTQSQTSGTSYPAIYRYYDAMTIGENTIFNVSMPGSAIRLQENGASCTIKAGAKVNLTSLQESNAIVAFSGNNQTFSVEPGAYFFAIGKSNRAVIDMSTNFWSAAEESHTGNQFIMKAPKTYDIRNTGTNNNSTALDVAFTNRADNTFIIEDSDIDLWKKGSALMGPSDETYALVEKLQVNGTGTNESVTSTDTSGLQNFKQANYKRIAGMNSNPELKWVPVTDADYSYKARVLIGYVADEQFDPDGNTVLIPVYASENQAEVTYVDTFGDTHVVKTDSEGYATVSDTRFNTAGQTISGSAVRGPWTSEADAVTTVLDVTPPEPAELVEGKVTNATKQLTAENLEPNAKVFLTITSSTSNAGTLVPAGTVAADGTWSHNLSSYLNAGDSVTIYLQDNAGEATGIPDLEFPMDPVAPSTNSADGNINPYPSDLSYRDATFKKATNYIVEDVIPDNPKLSKYSASSGGATTSIGDEVTYTLTAKNDKADSADWTGVVLEDVLAAGLDFDSTDHGITIKQIDASGTETTIPLAADTFTYNETTRLLSIKLGDAPAKYSYVVTFKVTVASDATVDQDILNQATAKGYSPQESANPFVPGPIAGPFKVIDVLSNEVGLPGGTLYGILQLTSAPDVIDFKKHALTVNDTRMDNPELSAPLTVSDSRGNRTSWTLTAKLTKVMANTEDGTKILTDAIKFNDGTTEESLALNSELTIKTHTHASAGDYVVSDDWSANGAGLKLEVPAGGVPKLGKYQAEITWILGDTPTP